MDYFQQYISKKANGLYFLIMIIISVLAFKFALPLIWMVFATVTILVFFQLSFKYSVAWASYTEISFEKKLFSSALVIRLVWVVFSYFFYKQMTGQPFEFMAADSVGYHEEALWMVDVLKNGDKATFWSYYLTRLSDMGYPAHLILIYSLFGKSILVARIVKALLGAITVLLIYRLAVRNFGDKIGRLAGILALLYPNLIYYTGLHVKETEMVFLLVFFIERADFLLRRKKVHLGLLILVLLLGVSLYFFRAVLAYSAFLALIATLIFSREDIFRLKKSMAIIFSIVAFVSFVYGSAYLAEATQYWEDRFSNQELSLEHRTRTNALAQYGSAVAFAPFSLIAPFPTFVNIETQQNHMLMSGAFFVKNIMAFFVLIALLSLLRKQRWKNHVLILAIMVGYITILAMSKFALVERFHMPVLPFHIILSAYGISQLNQKNIKYFPYYLFFIAVVIIGWNWFKLAGRGLI